MKRVLAVVLSVVLLMSVVLTVNAYSTEKYKNGDVNRNGTVSISDATEIQRYLACMTIFYEEQTTLADFNLDGVINIMDVTKIQMVLANIEDFPSEPTTPTQPSTEEKVDDTVNIYFTNNKSWTDVYFYMYNSVTGEENGQWPGQKILNYSVNEYGEKVYCGSADTKKFDRIIFNNGADSQTVNTALSKASSGFFIQSGHGTSMIPGTYAYTGADAGTLVTTNLEYSTGYNKKIWIWTPADYSATDAKKFKTLYIMDGQNLFDSDHSDSYGGWQVTDAVESLMANGGRGMIIVGIDNGNDKRDSELTPDIGQVKPIYQSSFGVRTGEAFSDFVVNKVMPYVQSKYNSSTLPEDNAIVGSSSGGLESFYIGMENMDKFGHIGALSPAFALFDESVWNTYLSKYNFASDNLPRLYIYNGNADSVEKELYADTVGMYENLTDKGYNSHKITLVLEENGYHNEGYWRLIFPEMLCWCYQP